ncbi:TrmB family transcriptional regulator [Methanococcus voltae]|jgi:predicted transcriptional regulator|uniref:Transcriptional regulator, TrmB n=1 Tax=Methanococcus voltae (strain ATCC BAA-1334 / A3) TaxID=456320 RepID=D7DS97_METV3|nr:TrmB family transcriptional regulator [Methanococcus voltae]MCS3901533.1 putative transcriptional regulator [Methanococcus voltae]
MTKEEFREINLNKSTDPLSNFDNKNENNECNETNENIKNKNIGETNNNGKNDLRNIHNINETKTSNISNEIYSSRFETTNKDCIDKVYSLDDLDPNILKKISSLFSSEVRAKIYIFLRMYPESTVEEIAEGTNIYSSTVRDYIVEMYRNDYVIRKKIKKSKFGKKPYVYCAIEPTLMAKKVSKSLKDKITLLANIDMFFNPQHDEKTVIIDVISSKSSKNIQ